MQEVMIRGETGTGGIPPTSRLADRLAEITAGFASGIAPAESRSLLITTDSTQPFPLSPLAGWAVYRMAGTREARVGTPGQHDPLPFADDAFDVICVYGAILQIVQRPALLNKVLRMLRPGGRAVVIEPYASFNFTSFPVGGPAHLLRRRLLEAGFRDVRALPAEERAVTLVAERTERRAPAAVSR